MNIGKEIRRTVQKPVRAKKAAPLALPAPAPLLIPVPWPSRQTAPALAPRVRRDWRKDL